MKFYQRCVVAFDIQKETSEAAEFQFKNREWKPHITSTTIAFEKETMVEIPPKEGGSEGGNGS